jgi:peptidyl-prolyl cis-trans isomerase B (cyclophilin B)
VFARIVEGLDVVAAISAVDADAKGMPATRVEILSVTIRDTPPPAPVPFAGDTAAELGGYRATIETPRGSVVIEMLADKAPETVRAFLQAAEAGVYDGTPFHRVVKGFVIQVGSVGNRAAPLTAAQMKWVHKLQPEFNDTAHVPGIVSMARGDAPDSAETSFFICTGDCHALDGQYTAFARVVSGMDVVQAIEGAPVVGETPADPVVVTRITIGKKDVRPRRRGRPQDPHGIE